VTQNGACNDNLNKETFSDSPMQTKHQFMSSQEREVEEKQSSSQIQNFHEKSTIYQVNTPRRIYRCIQELTALWQQAYYTRQLFCQSKLLFFFSVK